MAFWSKYWPSGMAGSGEALPKDDEPGPASKWAKTADKGDGRARDARDGRGKGRSQHQGNKRQHELQRPSSQQSRWNDWRPQPDNDMLANIQRLLLRREDMLALIRAEYGFVFFFRVDVGCSVIRPLFTAQKEWRDAKSKAPESLTKPMRTALMSCLVKELSQRVQQLKEPASAEHQATLAQLGWIKPVAGDDPMWSYLKWDPEKKTQVVDETKEGLLFAKVVATLAAIGLPFCLQTGMRTDEADRLNNYLRELSNNACTQLIAMSMRPERVQRSALAQYVAKQLGWS